METKRYEVSTYVPALYEPEPYQPRQYPSIIDSGIMPAANLAMPTRTQQRAGDNAVELATATLLVAGAYGVAALMISTGLMVIVWIFRGLGEGWATYTFTGLLVWGICILLALWGNRRQGLHHSASGIEHHAIDSRERIARHAIDVHAQILLHQLGGNHDRQR